MPKLTRRSILAGLACSTLIEIPGKHVLAAATTAANTETGFHNILRIPDSVTVFLGLNQPVNLQHSAERWEARRIRVATRVQSKSLGISIEAPGTQPTHVCVRWNTPSTGSQLILGDAWERSYGDLNWTSLVPERILPWYFLTRLGNGTHGYGVKTGAKALCFWQLDADGITLWLDVSNGGAGVELGERELTAATIVSREGLPGESAMEAATAFCKVMCEAPRHAGPIYGSNDWYYAYGHNSAEQIVRDAELIAAVAPGKGARPFTVIDDGWKDKRAFPDMGVLADAIRKRNVRPGLWIRPLQADEGASRHLLLPAGRFGKQCDGDTAPAYDPTLPEALQAVLAKVKEAKDWRYELLKHDFSTYELFGQWGSAMGGHPTKPGWSFHDQSKTNAEIAVDLYQAIRQTAGEEMVIVGCNTIGHLGAGIFDAQRTGDDVSGKMWERTRRMGVNTLAFRLPQHRTFFRVDADCVPITAATPWNLNAQWLDLVANSGTVLLVSAEPAAVGPEQREAIRKAFQVSASIEDGAVPVDWLENTTPREWRFRGSGEKKTYDWYAGGGAWPFEI